MNLKDFLFSYNQAINVDNIQKIYLKAFKLVFNYT